MQIIVVKNSLQAVERVKEEIYERIDKKTILFLSGGSTPKPLYEILAKEKVIHPAGAAMVDERFGSRMHDNSNEAMIEKTGLLNYFSTMHIPFYPILKENMSREETAKAYDEKVRNLFFHVPKSIGILGIGADGHTAGIPARSKEREAKRKEEKVYNKTQDFVISYDDGGKKYGQRITLTFAGLALLDFIVILVLGKDKKKALKKMFEKGSLEEIPARFYLQQDIIKKTILITDQKI